MILPILSSLKQKHGEIQSNWNEIDKDMEFDDEIDHSILLTDDPFHPSAKKKISPPSTQKWHGKGSKAWFIIQMSRGDLRGKGFLSFLDGDPNQKHGVIGWVVLVTKKIKRRGKEPSSYD